MGDGENDQRWWLNIETGEVSPNQPPIELAVRGGMLCDEPGLGKTITVAGLILRNIGRIAKPPPPPPPPPPSQAEVNFSFWCKEDKAKCLLGILRRIQKLDGSESFNCLISSQSLACWGMTRYGHYSTSPIEENSFPFTVVAGGGILLLFTVPPSWIMIFLFSLIE